MLSVILNMLLVVRNPEGNKPQICSFSFALLCFLVALKVTVCFTACSVNVLVQCKRSKTHCPVPAHRQSQQWAGELVETKTELRGELHLSGALKHNSNQFYVCHMAEKVAPNVIQHVSLQLLADIWTQASAAAVKPDYFLLMLSIKDPVTPLVRLFSSTTKPSLHVSKCICRHPQ